MFNCTSCGGTGLYSGLCEGPGKAVICVKCKGSGSIQFHDSNHSKPVPFVGRVRRTDIHTVYVGGGTMIFMGAGPKGNGITYEQFWNGSMPSVK